MTVISNTYDYLDYLSKVEAMPVNSDWNSSAKDEGDWSGGFDYDEAHDKARHGWLAGIDELDVEDKINVDGGVHLQHGIYGSVVDVGSFLDGQPDCMINFVDEVDHHREEMTLYVKLDYHCGYSKEDAMKYCKKLLDVANHFQAKFSIRIVGYFSSRYSDHESDLNTFIVIKEPNERFVMNAIAFSMHPSFFRRIYFRYIEQSGVCEYGYGRPNEGRKMMKFVRAHCQEYMYENPMYVPSLQEDGYKWEIEDVKKLFPDKDKK